MSDITYENIICEESHNGQECSFPKRVLTKLKMLFTIAVATVAAVVTFSGCSSVKADVKQTTVVPTTGQVIEVTTAKDKIEETTTTNPVTEEFISTTIKVPETTYQDIQITTEVSQTTQKVTEGKTTQEETKQENITTTKKQVETTKHEVQDNEYNRLLENLNNELSKKSFSEEVKSLFLDTFEALYKNYLGWQKGYKDLPSREEYIKTNLIDVIGSIDEINFYRSDSEEANKLLEEGMPLGWVEYDENNRTILNIISEPSNTKDEELRLQGVENFFHEIIHCKEKGINLSEDIDVIFTEGRSYFSYEIYKTSK